AEEARVLRNMGAGPLMGMPPQMENLPLRRGELDSFGDTLQAQRIEPAERMRIRPQIAAGENVTDSTGLPDFVPGCKVVTADVHVGIHQPRRARAQGLFGVARQAALHPCSFIPAGAGTTV